MTNLLDVAPAAAKARIEQLTRDQGLESYRAEQAFGWLWSTPVRSWHRATNLPRSLAEGLERRCPITAPELVTEQESVDGTRKFLWRFDDGAAVESVLIPEGKRITLCISSQVGCAFGCSFCATGTMGFGRNLEPSEIVAQVREMSIAGFEPTNVVFMGMGEPLHNWRAVDSALTILNSPDGAGIGARHITVSTVGLLPQLAKLAARPEQFRLAVSLHAAIPSKRAEIMPVERKYPLPRLMEALKSFSRRVTFEYVMIEGFNDAVEDVEALASLATPLGAHVNLLPLHPGGDPALRPSPPARIESFSANLRERGVNSTVRRSRGKDIDAACGQLKLGYGEHGRGG